MSRSIPPGQARPTLRRAPAGALLVGWALAWASACAAAPGGAGEPPPAVKAPARDSRRAEVRFPTGRLFVAEIADTPELLERGYMFRKAIGETEGMIFVFPAAGFHPFWMKNTLVPLDMIWMDDAFTVVHVETSMPPCTADPCPSYGPPRLTRYVFEVKGGIAAGEALKIGDRLRVSFPQPAG